MLPYLLHWQGRSLVNATVPETLELVNLKPDRDLVPTNSETEGMIYSHQLVRGDAVDLPIKTREDQEDYKLISPDSVVEAVFTNVNGNLSPQITVDLNSAGTDLPNGIIQIQFPAETTAGWQLGKATLFVSIDGVTFSDDDYEIIERYLE